MMNLRRLNILKILYKNFFKKNIPKKSGFMLSEVMIALAVVGVLILPVFGVIDDFLLFSVRYRDKKDRLLVMKNMMVEQGYKARHEKAQSASLEKILKASQGSGLRGTLKYTREVMKKTKPFEKFSKETLQNLCKQKVVGSFGAQKETLVSFLYKPKQ